MLSHSQRRNSGSCLACCFCGGMWCRAPSHAHTLQRHRGDILNRCDHRIHTSKLESINNTIKRTACGYHDERYFRLKVKQAFDEAEYNKYMKRREEEREKRIRQEASPSPESQK